MRVYKHVAAISNICCNLSYVQVKLFLCHEVSITLLLIHTIYNSLQHALIRLNILYRHRLSPGNGFERRSFFTFRVHVHTDRRLSQLLLFPLLSQGTFVIKVKVTLRLTVGQSASLGVEPHLGLMTRYLLLFDSYVLVFVGRPFWREGGSVFCICWWPSPA
jgi:hypothetical protein